MNESTDRNITTQDQVEFIKGKLMAVVKQIRGYL